MLPRSPHLLGIELSTRCDSHVDMRQSSKRLTRKKYIGFGALAAVLVIILIVVVAVLGATRRRSSSQQPKPNTFSENNSGFDHRSHAVPGSAYDAIDFDSAGSAEVTLDGTRSHSHYFDPGPPVVTGKIVSYSWFYTSNGDEFSSEASPTVRFPMGTTKIGLKVTDNTGDSNAAYTTVTVRKSVVPGSYCYYYNISGLAVDEQTGFPVPDKLDTGADSPKPVDAEQNPDGVNYESLSDFSSHFQGSPFVLRCVFQVPANGVTVKPAVSHAGGPVRMLVNNVLLLESSSNSGEKSFTLNVQQGDGIYEFHLMYYRKGSGKSNSALTVTGLDSMACDLARVVPVVLAIVPSGSTLDGGGKAKISGVGLFSRVYVNFGNSKLQAEASNIDLDSVIVTVPKASAEGTVSVSVQNSFHMSNSVEFTYSKTGLPPLKFAQYSMQTGDGVAMPSLLTSIVYGPDHRWYVGSLDSHVYSFAVSQTLVLSDICQSESLGTNRSVLAVTFNPADTKALLYVATSVLYWKKNNLITSSDGWKNGKVVQLQPSNSNSGGSCLQIVKEVITGLPVSNHDHGVNSLVFDQSGGLLIQVGGFTNAGVNNPGNMLGGLDESTLSAASLFAPVNDAGFDGKITYDGDDPGSAKQVSGDVSVYSPGFRNSFDICFHSNGILVATDNGANVGFGDVSVDCTQSEPLDDNKLDELIVVKKNKYAGHPNRFRGKDDSRQCTYIDSSEPGNKEYEAPLATFESSTDGVMEYTANVLGGQLKGNILASKYSTDQSEGRVYRVQIDKNNEVIENGVDSLWEASGLSIAMSPWGDIFMPRVYTNEILVLRPIYQIPNVPMFSAVLPFRGPVKGGNLVQVSGHNLGNEPTAYFGVNPCSDVTDIAADGTGFKCKVPSGGKGASVQVSVKVKGGATAESSGGVDYIYMEI